MIQDQFTNLNVSRQRKWQLRKTAEDKCEICAVPAVGGGRYCLKHALNMTRMAHIRMGYKRYLNNTKYMRILRGLEP